MSEGFTVQPAKVESHQLGFVKLPFDNAQFKEFVAGLLGKPQTLSRSFKGPFEVDENFIEHLYELVHQRIQQQNNARLIQFMVAITFSDQCTVELNSFDLFKTFNEIKPVVANSLIVTWDYLVQFQDKEVPEKQQIQISFTGKYPFHEMEDEIPYFSYSGSIDLRIKHTARTWATDIESLLSSQIKTILLPKSRVMSFLKKHEYKLSVLISAFFVLGALIASFFSTVVRKNQETAAINAALSDSIDIQNRMDFIINYIAQGIWAHHFFIVSSFVVFSYILSTGFWIWFSESILRNEPSFLLFTKESEKKKFEAIRKKKMKWFSLVMSVISSLTTGIVGNILFVKYFQ